jgi:hypothetical protein
VEAFITSLLVIAAFLIAAACARAAYTTFAGER